MHKRNLGRGESNQFTNLPSIKTKDKDLLPYCQHLAALNSDFNQRFEDILHMTIPDWELDFFSTINTDECPNLQEELIELITYQEITLKFKNGYQQFWLQKHFILIYLPLHKSFESHFHHRI